MLDKYYRISSSTCIVFSQFSTGLSKTPKLSVNIVPLPNLYIYIYIYNIHIYFSLNIYLKYVLLSTYVQ